MSNNNPSSLGVGVTQRRLRRELVRQMSAQVRREEEEFRMMSKQEKRDYRARQRGEPIKKKREMLRHEKTEIFGAGILMILPTTACLPSTEAKDAWSNPKTKLTLRGRFDPTVPPSPAVRAFEDSGSVLFFARLVCSR